jgi:hypothetical protein
MLYSISIHLCDNAFENEELCLFDTVLWLLFVDRRQSKDHKPLMKSERFRVQALGGFVSDQGRIQGSGANIAVARAIGTL